MPKRDTQKRIDLPGASATSSALRVVSSADTGGMDTHDLFGPYHSGELDRTQATWVATDIASAITTHTAIEDAHHPKQHGILDATHHTFASAQYSVLGAVTLNTLGLLPTHSDVAAHPNTLLRSDNIGGVAVASLRTSAIDTATGDLTITPASGVTTLVGTTSVSVAVQTPLLTTATNVDLLIDPGGSGAVKFPNSQTVRTSTFDSSPPLIKGWQFNEVSAGSQYSALSIGKIKANELIVDIFVANETRVDRGDQFWTKSYGILYADMTTPANPGETASVTFEDSPAITGAIFSPNDWLLLRKLDITTGLALFNVWGQVSGYTGNGNGSQTWTFTLRNGPGNKTIPKGSLAIDFGAQGAAFLHLSTVDPAGAPYLKMRKWAGSDPFTASNYTTYVQLGHLGSLGNPYYSAPAGSYGLYLRSAAYDDQFLVADDNGLQLRGATVSLWNGTNQTVLLSNAAGVNLDEDVWGSWDNRRALQWWPDVATMTGTPSLSIFTGKAVGGATNNQNFSYIDARPTGNVLAGLTLSAYGQGTGANSFLYLESGSQALATPATATLSATTINLNGAVTATSLSVGGVAVSIAGHTHSYLPLAGGTLTGTLTARSIIPTADNTYSIGDGTHRVQDLYAVNLHVNTIVGTPTYAHSHDAGDITTGTLSESRLPHTWTTALTLDADSGGTYNYLRFKTDAVAGKVWDLIAYAQDHATTGIRNDLALTYNDGATSYTVWAADSGTRVVDFSQTPTVAGTSVSLSTHNHDAAYAALTIYNLHVANANAHHNQSHVLATTAGLGGDHTVSGLTAGQVLRASSATAAAFATLDHSELSGLATGDPHTQYLLATGTRAGATSQAQAFNVGVVTPSLTTASGNLTIAPSGGTTAFTGQMTLTASTGPAFTMTNTATTQYSTSTLILRNTEVSDAYTHWYIMASKSAAGAATGATSFEIRKRNATQTEAITPFAINASNDIILNASYSVGTQTYGNVGVKKAPGSSYALDVNGNIAASGSIYAPQVTTSAGALTLAPTTDLLLSPGSNFVKLPSGVAFQSDNYASQTTGLRLTYTGQIDARYVYTDEMHAKSFMADIEQALAGGQIIGKSVTLLYNAFTAPAAGGTSPLVVRDLPSAPGMAVFVNGDALRLRTFARTGGSLTIGDCWGTITLDTTYGTNGFDSTTKSQRYTFTRSTAPNAGAMPQGTVMQPDAIILDYGTSGNGYYEVSAVDGAYGANSPYSQIVTWSTHPRNTVIRVRMGNLYGVWAQSGEYGLYAGDGTANTNQYLRISNSGVKLNNIPIQLYNGNTQTVNIDSAGTNIWIGPDSNNKRLQWDGTTLTVTGKIVIQANSSGYAALSDKPANLAAINNTEGTKLSGIASNATVGATWGTNLSSIPTRFGDTPSAAGLYLTPTHLGYFDGSLWKAWIANTGEFYFGGSSGAHLEWNGAKLRGLGADGTTEQWYADASTGKLYAGAGQVWMDTSGVNFAVEPVGSNPSLIRFMNGATLLGSLGYFYSAGPIPSANDGMIFYNGNTTKFRFVGASATEFDHPVSATGLTVGGVAVSLAGHTHSYLPLSGGTLTGTLTARSIIPTADNTYSIGDGTHRVQDLYAVNLHINTIVGTPTYAHSHDAGDITTGTLDENRLPHTWTGALTLDADSSGTYNYLRFKTDAVAGKVWDLIAYAQDHATTGVRNDLALVYSEGATSYTVWATDSGTRVVDFSQTPTVSGTRVSLSTHNHDAAYVALATYTNHLTNDAHTQYLLATGTRAGATSQAQAFTVGVVTPSLTTASGNLSITPAGGTTTVTGAMTLTNATGTNFVINNTATTQYSSAAFVLRNVEVADAYTNWYFFAEKNSAGSAAGVSTFQLRRRNASGTEAITPFVVNGNCDVILNGGYTNGAQTYGNVGIKKAPGSSIALDVSGNIAASGVVFLASGDATAPGLAATGDTNTGVYFPSADNLAVTTGGVQRLLIDNAGTFTLNSRASLVVGANTLDLNPLPDATGTSEVRLFRLTNTSGSKGLRILQGDNTTTTVHYLGVNATTVFNAALADLDFNVRGDNDTNLLYVDASTDKIGVGVSTPQAKLHVYSSADEILRLESSNATGSPYLTFMQGGTRRGFIQQHDSSDTLTLASEYGNVTIKAAATAGTDSDTAYVVVKAGGNVGINTADPQYPLDVTGDIYVSQGMLSNAWNISAQGGATFTDSVYTPAIYANGTDLTLSSVTGNTSINGSANVDLRLNNVSQWLINSQRLLPRSTVVLDIGDYNRRVRTLHAAELYVETLVAQGVLATIGGRILVAPTTRLIADMTAVATTIDLAHNNLVNGAYIYLNAAPGGVSQLEAMQVTSTATTISGGYRYTVTRNLDGSGANTWNVGDAVVSLGNAVGQGYIDLSSTSTIHSHYGPAQTMYVRTSTATWNGVKPVTTTGNLRSFVDYSADEFGFATGNDLTLTPSTGFRGVTVDRTNGVRLFNTDIKLYSGSTLQAAFDYADGLNMLADSSASARRQQINWWSNMADRSGTPLTELYTYLNASSGPTLSMKTRAATGVNGVLLELVASGNSAVAGSIYITEDTNAVKKIVLDSNNVHLRYNATDRLWVGSGGVGVNQTTASYALDVNGSCHATSFPTSSDARLKTVLGPVDNVLDRLEQINAYRFHWSEHYHGYDQFLDKQGRPVPQIGFIAQEVLASFPELVSQWQHTGRNGEVLTDALAVDYSRMVPILLMAIRELRAEVAALRSH